MDTEIGRKAKSFMNEGKLVPDDVMVELMTTTLKDLDKNPDTKNWLLDGFQELWSKQLHWMRVLISDL